MISPRMSTIGVSNMCKAGVVAAGYLETILNGVEADPESPDQSSLPYVRSLCEELISNDEMPPADKQRALGFVQGVLVTRHMLAL